jgi:hypothetical protein
MPLQFFQTPYAPSLMACNDFFIYNYSSYDREYCEYSTSVGNKVKITLMSGVPNTYRFNRNFTSMLCLNPTLVLCFCHEYYVNIIPDDGFKFVLFPAM